ncbi:hypothetical protein BH10PSE2_BH10PSE2_13080 [soil metagenome]
MAKRPNPATQAVPKKALPKKTLSAANLEALGAGPLSVILMEAADGDGNLKRRLRMELAANVGAPDLAFEIDKRLATLAASRVRVSWRKRPDLIADLQSLRRMIVQRLGLADARLALDRLVAWFDLYPGLTSRVKDPKGELALMFDAASADLAELATVAGVEAAAPVLGEALQTRLSEWGAWVGRGAPKLGKALAVRLLADLTQGRPRPSGRMALVVRKLADRAGDLDAWIAALPDDDQRKPEIGAEIARRLAEAGRAAQARTMLEGSRPPAQQANRFGRAREAAPVPPPESWLTAEIAVLEAEGRSDDALAARWTMFERTLAEAPLRAILAGLPDFEDVVALDRALAHAAGYPDATRGLAFLMAWPAHREAAEMVMARAPELRGSADDVPLWAARLEGRYPAAALSLLRSRALALTRLGGAATEVEALVAEAAALAEVSEAADHVGAHAEFLTDLQAASLPGRRGWRG